MESLAQREEDLANCRLLMRGVMPRSPFSQQLEILASALERRVSREGGSGAWGGETRDKNILKCLQGRTRREGQEPWWSAVNSATARRWDPELRIFLGPLQLLCPAAVCARRERENAEFYLFRKRDIGSE